MAKKFTVKTAGAYLTAKSRGAKFSNRQLVLTPEFMSYAAHHNMQADLNAALRVRAEQSYNKKIPKRPTRLNRLAEIEYEETLKQANIAKAELSQVLYGSGRSNARLARRLGSYENYLSALRGNHEFYEQHSLGRLVGILGNTISFGMTKVSESDMAEMLGLIKELNISLDKFYKAYELMVSARYGSDDIARELLNIGDTVEKALENGGYTAWMKEKATRLVDLMSGYGLL